jgi:hypothetical protein
MTLWFHVVAHSRGASELNCWAGKIFIPVSNGQPVCKISESAK